MANWVKTTFSLSKEIGRNTEEYIVSYLIEEVMFGAPQINVNLEELRFYFDSQEKNVIDQGRYGYKAGIALSLRHKLMSLAEKEFDSAVNAIDRIISPAYKPNRLAEQKKEFATRKSDGQELFAAASSSGDEVSRV